MKKTLTAAALSSVLVLGLAAASQAADAAATTGVNAAGASKVTLDGSVRVRGVYDKRNAAQDTPGATAYDTRVQLGTKAQVSDAATGYIKLESASGSSDTDTWGNGGAAGLHTGGTKYASPTILEAWLNYKPGAFGVKAGHMPLALGNKVFFDHTTSGDDAIVVYGDVNGGATHVGALTIKFDEGSTSDNSNDLDGYVALVTHKVSDTMNLGANWTYLRGAAGDEAGPGNPGVTSYNGMSMSNIGLTADGKVGAISYLADAEFQFGSAADDGTDTKDASGWAAKLGGNYDLGAGKIGLLFGYGSGKDQRDADLNTAKEDQDQFINFLADTTYDTIIAGYRSAFPGNGMKLSTSSPQTNGGLSNLTLFQLNGSTKGVCPLTGKDVSLFASASYMKLSEDTTNYNDGNGNPVWADKVGTELDLIATWSLTPGLSYKVEAAYLFVGDVYETAASGAGNDPDNLVFLRHGLDLKF